MKKNLALIAMAATAITLTACGSKAEPITTDMDVTVDYILRIADDKGDVTKEEYIKNCKEYEVIDTSYEDVAKACEIYNPQRGYGSGLTFTTGKKQVIKGFENAVIGKEKGESLVAKILPEDGYGEVRQDLIVEHDNDKIAGKKGADGKVTSYEVGDMVENDRRHIGVITKVTDKKISIDRNHALAGKTLIFNVSIIDAKKTEKKPEMDQEEMMKKLQEAMKKAEVENETEKTTEKKDKDTEEDKKPEETKETEEMESKDMGKE